MFKTVSNSVGSSGPEDIFEEDCYSPSSLSSSSSVPPVASLPGRSVCTSCGLEIVDRYLLKVNDLCWHVRCLSCSVCNTSLGRHVSCYIKDKQVFCKLDYFRRYGTRCARCGRNIHSSDWVRRARGSTFHLACFSCTSCRRQLSTGEECGLLENRVFCRPHYDIMVENIKRAKENEEPKEDEEGADKEDSSPIPRPAKRARTSFTVDQLQVMQTQLLKITTQMLRLSRNWQRGLVSAAGSFRFWFQNCRARSKEIYQPKSCYLNYDYVSCSWSADATINGGSAIHLYFLRCTPPHYTDLYGCPHSRPTFAATAHFPFIDTTASQPCLRCSPPPERL